MKKQNSQDNNDQLTWPDNKKTGRLTWPAVVASKLKSYDNDLEMKLPNELRGSLKNYNYRSEHEFLIDENDYTYF
jgi:hypothetical protein